MNVDDIQESRTPEVVHQEDGKWFFWEETWAHRQGPFDTEKEARETLDRYCREVLGHEG